MKVSREGLVFPQDEGFLKKSDPANYSGSHPFISLIMYLLINFLLSALLESFLWLDALPRAVEITEIKQNILSPCCLYSLNLTILTNAHNISMVSYLTQIQVSACHFPQHLTNHHCIATGRLAQDKETWNKVRWTCVPCRESLELSLQQCCPKKRK